MSKLLKSKFILGAVMALALVVGGVVSTSPAQAATCTITSTLRVGSKGAQVMCLQSALGLTADGSFGPKTKAAVVAFQAGHGLTADGVFGPMSRAAWMADSVSMTFPAGCTSATGFSATTGVPCNTGVPVNTTLPAGCTSTAGFSPITGASCATGAVTNQSGPLSVSLAIDNPPAGNLIQGQATADLAHFAFTGSGTLTQLTLQRSGISDNSVFPNVYLYNGNTRLTSAASVNTLGQIVFNGLNIAVNGTLDLSVRADIVATGNESTVMVALTGYMVSGAAAANTVNISGNTFVINSGTGILSTVLIGANQWAGTSPSVSAGTTGYSLWAAPVTVSLHSVWLKSANFEFIGSAPSNAFANLGLYANGQQIATSTGINAQGFITFDLSAAPYSMTTGATTLEVRGDIVNGSARTAQLSLQNASDLMVTDSQVGVNVSVQGPTQGSIFSPNNGAAIQIQQGSLVASTDPAFSSVTNVTGGATNIAIASFKLASYGEDVKINTIQVTPTVTAGPNGQACGAITAGESALSNVTLYYNGGPIGSSQNAVFPTAASCAITPLLFNPGSNLTVAGGTTGIFQIHADLVNTAGLNYNSGSVSASVTIPAGDYQGMTSNQTNVTLYNFPSSNALNIQTGSLTIGSNTAYLSQTISPNTSGAKIGSYTIQNNSTSEAVQVNSLTVNLCTTSGAVPPTGSQGAATPACTTGFAFAPITNISTLSLSGIPGTQPTPIGQPTASNVFSTNFTIPAGGTQTVDVLANLGSTNVGNIVTNLSVLGVGASSRVPLTPAAVAGQTIGLSVGTVNAPVLIGSASTNAQYISTAGTGAVNAAQETYNFVASTGTANIVGLKFAALTGVGTHPTSNSVTPFTTVGSSGVVAVASTAGFAVGDNVLITTTGLFGGTNAVGTVSSLAGGLTINVTTAMVAGTTDGTTPGTVATSGTSIYQLAVKGVTGVALNSPGIATGSASFNNGIAYLSAITGATGNGIMIPNTPSGVTLPVFMSFGPVNTNGGVASGSTGQVLLEYVQYQTGSNTAYLAPAVPGTTLTLVGSKPNLTLNSSGAALTNGSSVLLGSVTVTADNGGDIALSEIPLTVSLNAGTGGTPVIVANHVTLTDTNGVTLANFTATNTTGATSATATEVFGSGTANHYRISAGTSKTFEIHADFTGSTFGTSATASVSLGANTSFVWDDINGGVASSVATNGTITSGLTGAALYSYPNGSVSIHN